MAGASGGDSGRRAVEPGRRLTLRVPRNGYVCVYEHVRSVRIEVEEGVWFDVEHNGETVDVIVPGEDGEREAVYSVCLEVAR